MAGPEIIPVSGFARGAFAPIADVFARAVAEQGRGGAALAIRHRGEVVVDLVGGDFADDTLVRIYSVSKAVTATSQRPLVSPCI